MGLRKAGLAEIRFYTFDSNFIGMIASGILFLFLLTAFIHVSESIPKWVVILKYMATCSLAVTFLVVIFVLAPMYSDYYSSLGKSYAALLFGGSNLFMHFLCPVIAIFTVLFFDPSLDSSEKLFNKKPTPVIAAFIAVILTVIYAIITLTLNITGDLTGPYPFLMVHSQPVWASCLWVIAIFALAYLIAWILARYGTLLKASESSDK